MSLRYNSLALAQAARSSILGFEGLLAWTAGNTYSFESRWLQCVQIVGMDVDLTPEPYRSMTSPNARTDLDNEPTQTIR